MTQSFPFHKDRSSNSMMSRYRRRTGIGVLMIGAVAAGWFASRIPTLKPTLGQVVSGSMEPAIPSPLLEMTCQRCQTHFGSIQSSYQESLPVFCIHCGSDQVTSKPIPKVPEIHLQELTNTTPLEVGQIVTFLPDGSEQLEIKRIVALPNTEVEVRQGDLWIDGLRYQKSLRDFLRQAILVHSQDSLVGDSSRWQKGEHFYRYQHRLARQVKADDSDKSSPLIRDDFWMNQGERFSPVPVSDVGVVFDFKVTTKFQRLETTLESHGQKHHVVLEQRQGRWNIIHRIDGDDAPMRDQKWLDTKRPNWFAVAIVDGQLLAGTESRSFSLANVPGDSSQTAILDSHAPPSTSLSFRFDPDASSIRSVMVVRDIFYRSSTDVVDGVIAKKVPGYTVLGDNVIVSDDSRHRFASGVLRSEIRKRVELPSDPLDSLRRQARLYNLRP